MNIYKTYIDTAKIKFLRSVTSYMLNHKLETWQLEMK
jgi:hypothetical protein